MNLLTKRSNSYFMDDPREKLRVAKKVDETKWVEENLTELLNGDESILEVGCGPGHLVASIARRFPDTQTTGIELCEDRFQAACMNLKKHPNATALQGDAKSIPFDSNHFDLVYSRFMLEYLPDPERAIQEFVRVCRPGGQVLLQDLDGQLIWHDGMEQGLASEVDIVVAHLKSTGFDPLIGRKLFGMASRSGLTELKVEVAPYHLYAGRIDDTNLELWELKLDIAIPQIVKALGSQSRAENLKKRFLDHLKDETTFTYSNLITVIGTVPDVPMNSF